MGTKEQNTQETDAYASQFAKRLRDARGDMPQADFLRLLKEHGLDLRQARLSHYENGRNYPDPPILATLATVLGVSADWLLGLTTEQLPVADLEEKLAKATGEHKINRLMGRLSKEKQQQVMSFAEFLLQGEDGDGAASTSVPVPKSPDDPARAESNQRAAGALFRVMRKHMRQSEIDNIIDEILELAPEWRELLASARKAPKDTNLQS